MAKKGCNSNSATEFVSEELGPEEFEERSYTICMTIDVTGSLKANF